MSALWGWMRGRWLRMVSFVEEREDATSLAVFRIVIGATLFCHLGRSLIVGAAAFTWSDAESGGTAHRVGVLAHLGGATPDNANALVALVCLAALCITFGLGTRAAVVVAGLGFRSLLELNVTARSGYDSLLLNALFLLLLSGGGRALSLDACIFRRARQVARWPRMLGVLQLGLLYGGSAVMKASSGWVPGGDASALWFIIHQPMWSRFAALPDWMFPLTQLATTFTWLWELSAPLVVVAVWTKESGSQGALARLLARVRFRELWLVGGVLMHVGIEVAMEVGAFSPAALAFYACAIHPREWNAAFTRARLAVAGLKGSWKNPA